MAEEKKSSKLTYEQLEAYAQQTTEQAKKIFQENQMLKQAIDKLTYENSLREIECALNCMNHKDVFSEKFIKTIAAKIEEILTPNGEESKETDNVKSKE